MDSGKFRLPGKKQLYLQADNWQVIVVDVTESPIERPKKSGCNRAVGEDVSLDGLLSVRCTKQQKAYYSGKKKHHTLKA